jgi:cobalt-zinc-cadmium efflux system outer membrane protein
LVRYEQVQQHSMRIPHKHQPPRLAITLLCAIGLSGAFAQTPKLITLPEALAAATQNIDAQISKQLLNAARADVTAANRGPLPVLSTGVSQIDLQRGVGAGSWLQEKRIDKNIGLDWTWERGNKRALRTEAATQAANASAQDLRELLVQQKLIASNAFFDLLAAQQRISQVSSIATSAQQLASAAAKRLAAGDLSAQDTARSNIEAQRAKNEILIAEQSRTQAELTLNLILDLGPQKLIANAPEATASKAYSSVAPSMLPAESRADVQAAMARVEASRAALTNALALKQNDVTLGTAFDHFPGTSTRLLTFRMSVPLQMSALGGYSFGGEIARAEAQLAIAEAALERARHAAHNDAQRLAQELQSSQARAVSYNDGIAPEAKRVADQAELAYNKGALSLTDLLEARRIWRATTLEAISAQTDFEKAQTAWNIRLESLK